MDAEILRDSGKTCLTSCLQPPASRQQKGSDPLICDLGHPHRLDEPGCQELTGGADCPAGSKSLQPPASGLSVPALPGQG